MPALRLMTYNIQCLPLVVATAQQRTDDAAERAGRVADSLLNLPNGNRPDVIAFNEVFSEDARDVLVSRLKSTWPHIIKSVHDGGVLDDSGLMLFSRYAFLPLFNGDIRYEHFYKSAESTDALAAKAACIVQIGVPFDRTTLVFSHMQASSDTEDQYSDVRLKQFDEIREALDDVFQQQLGPFGQVILIGDLNVRGDSGAVSGEYAKVFASSATQLFGPLLDGWGSYMHAPKNPKGSDQGYSNIDFAKSGALQRLDYMCFGRRDQNDIALMPQHMFIRLRNGSDHFALEAVIQRASQNCIPAEAIDFLIQPSFPGGTGAASQLRMAQLNFALEGSYQWLFVEQPGTYTPFCTPNVVYDVYLQSDLTNPVLRLDGLSKGQLSPNLQAGFREDRIDPNGNTFVCREPFFIAARDRGAKAGTGVMFLLEHRGESAATAIGLAPHVPTASSFPVGQKLGADDICWFKSRLPQIYSAKPHNENFRVTNPRCGDFKIGLHDASETQTAAVSGTSATLDLSTTTNGDELVYLTIARGKDTLDGFIATWVSPVSYLDLQAPLFVRINDETGVDWPGADEPELTVTIDDEVLYDGAWDDADTDENWPGLAETIRSRVTAKGILANRIGFVTEVFVSAFDPDFNAQGVFPSGSITPLIPADDDVEPRLVSLTIPDVVSDGLYSFGCTIARFQ